MMFTNLFTISACLATKVFAAPVTSSEPLRPSRDPFYTAPADFETTSPGTILRLRVAPGNLTTTYGNTSATYNILFRTTDSNYEPSWAVTTLFVPKNSSGDALLSYQIPYNSADVDSSPSYSLYAYQSFTSLQNSDISNALGEGWYVSIPDHEGPHASFGLGLQEGHTVLDSVRAVRAAALGLKPDAKAALWGYSGGSIASEWAAELQGQYAPELIFAGAAIGGVVQNVTQTLLLANGNWSAGLVPQLLLGITSQNTTARDYLVSQLKSNGLYNRTTFLAALSQSIEESFVLFNGSNVLNEYFQHGAAVLSNPIIQHILNNNGVMGYHGIPQMPMYVYKAFGDELAPVSGTNALVKRFCAVGVDVLYERNTIGGHLAEYTNGDASAFGWLQRVLNNNGKSTTYGSSRGCIIRDVALNVTDSPI